MADYFTGSFPTGGYQATHKGNSDLSSPWTPNFEISEGMRFGLNYPAPYLPLERYEPTFQDYKVIAAGKPVALDVDGFMVPAGYRLLYALGAGNGPQYTQTDVDHGVLKADGTAAAVNDYVIDTMITESKTVGRCCGVASYDAYQLSGSDPTNPATYRRHNYNRQTGVAILTDYYLEFPVEPYERIEHTMTATIAGADQGDFDFAHNTVLDYTVKIKVNGRRDVDFTFVGGTPDKADWNSGTTNDYLKIGDQVEVEYLYENTGTYNAPFAGIASWRGSAAPGDLVTYDQNSAFITYAPGTIDDTSTGDRSAQIAAEIDATLDILGTVYLVDTNFPKQFLDRVKTAYDPRLTGDILDGRTGLASKLDRMPGSATDGMPHNVFYAGGDQTTGIVRFNLNVR
jgi:hypothetical protein